MKTASNPSRFNLAPDEVQLIGVAEGGHPFVVGGEAAAQIQAKQALLTTMNTTACSGDSTRTRAVT
jgi:hypothetical protein